jgi:fatty acid desaturase
LCLESGLSGEKKTCLILLWLGCCRANSASPARNPIEAPQKARKDLIAREDLNRLRQLRAGPNLLKIPMLFGLMALLTWIAWSSEAVLLQWSCYLAIGYLWMSAVTFMHDALHNTLFKRRWLNWVFGVITMTPLLVAFVAFKEDHLEHHRYNRSPKDPDAFTMGKRGVLDFVLFYAYAFAGVILSFIHFNLLYPIAKFNAKNWTIFAVEVLIRVAFVWLLISWAQANGVLAKTLEVWLIPIAFFSLFNSARFIAEHYGCPWDVGQLAGTRTIISNPVHSYFWNNINWHIGHHLYPSVPWYNLVELHELLKPEIAAQGAIVDKSYTAVFLHALLHGPESEEQLNQSLARRRRQSQPADAATAG